MRDTRDNTDPALAAFSSRVACVVDLAGDVDLNIPYGDAESNALIVRFLGGTADEVPDAYRDASPISWVDGDSAPFLILHATHDEWVPVAHARGMEAALHEAGVTVVYYEDPEAVHITSLTGNTSPHGCSPFAGFTSIPRTDEVRRHDLVLRRNKSQRTTSQLAYRQQTGESGRRMTKPRSAVYVP